MKLSIRDMILIGLFAALMVVGAYLKIPNPIFPTVPITLQLFFCLFAGLLLGSLKGALSQLIYVLLGLVGIPVFAGGGGFDYVLRPTFGFILGFILCAFVVGFIVEKVKSTTLSVTLIASIVGILCAYVIGILYMYFIIKFNMGKDTSVIGLSLSMVPYLIKDLVLGVIAAIAAKQVIPTLKKAGYRTVA